jgi:hypothetical protein
MLVFVRRGCFVRSADGVEALKRNATTTRTPTATTA